MIDPDVHDADNEVANNLQFQTATPSNTNNAVEMYEGERNMIKIYTI